MILGGIGTGKTLLMRWLGQMHYSQGYELYANFCLKGVPYHKVGTYTDFLNISTPKNFIMLDEWWKNADSRRSMSSIGQLSTNWTMQSRKVGGKAEGGGQGTHVCMTGQNYEQFDLRIRGIGEVFYRPEIIAYDDNNVPLLLKVEIIMIKGNKSIKRTVPIPLIYDFGDGEIDIPFAYDTYEDITEMESSSKDLHRKYFEKYWDFTGKQSQLQLILEYDDGLSGSEAKRIAGFIYAKRAQGETAIPV
jgi:hypothetical protein